MNVKTRTVLSRMATPTPRTRYTGEGICLGANVRAYGIEGQVWAQSPRKGMWWIATGERFIEAHEHYMTVLGQALEDVPLEGVA